MKKIIFSILGLALVLGSVSHGETLHLATENYPPFNMSTRGNTIEKNAKYITGISTEIVKELFKRADIDYTLSLYPWKKAYRLALEKKNHGVFSTAHTAPRENLFKWSAPLAENNWVFFAQKSRKITINTLEEAKSYRVGGYQGDAIALFLEEQGFKLSLPTQDRFNARMLAKGKIDLWTTGQLVGPYLAKQEGVSGLESVFIIKKVRLSIAFNKQVPNATIEHLNTTLQQMQQDGTVTTIYQRYQ